MRVLVNGISTLGGRTGVGHYTAQLLRCLREQAAGDVIASFPGRWVGQGRALWHRLRSRLRGESRAPAARRADAPPPAWRVRCVAGVQALRQAWLAAELRFRGRWGAFDLYHEPNHLALPCDLP